MKTVTIASVFFARNRQRLVASLLPNSVAILHANDEMNRTADQVFPYRQDSDLFYLTGINQEKTSLLIAPDHPEEELREILVIRRSNPKLETWEGHKLTREEASALSGIRHVKYQDELDSVLAPLMQHARHVYLNTPEMPKFIPDQANRNLRLSRELHRQFPNHAYERLAPVMRDLRVIKDKVEIDLIREAIRITRNAFLQVLKTIKPGTPEYVIEAQITGDFIRDGARGHAYPAIIASGRNACILHYTNNNSICQDGELLLMDFGAEYGNYAADCSRTLPVSGRFTERQKKLYQSVYDVFTYARSIMKPGSSIQQVHAEVCRRFGDEHVKLGLYSAEELANQDQLNPLYQRYYLHGTSHFLGLDVHDVGTKDTEFKPGMVLTCEPGIYIEEEATGIRLENNILITETGNVDLMEDIPLAYGDIEAFMRNR